VSKKKGKLWERGVGVCDMLKKQVASGLERVRKWGGPLVENGVGARVAVVENVGRKKVGNGRERTKFKECRY
jgi:hypothetical protein